jgi:MinD-like ATPase involved in chromosome partitioning or flagellar assembly
MVPSHRDIPRSVNDAETMVHSAPRSEAAKAFKSLAQLYEQVAAPQGNGSRTTRRRLRRSGR